MRKAGFAQKIITVDESMREIESLAELYDELLASRPADKRVLNTKKDEAKFARDRILKLSLHVKNLLANMESQEPLK
ncbi:hypothetical protein KY349_00060 [Candidatus Woesearchaeota archaeon]|jgi:hypothetical protein|nr:hypothetical protein [Candidatus Woesearchaeota archaeon]